MRALLVVTGVPVTHFALVLAEQTVRLVVAHLAVVEALARAALKLAVLEVARSVEGLLEGGAVGLVRVVVTVKDAVTLPNRGHTLKVRTAEVIATGHSRLGAVLLVIAVDALLRPITNPSFGEARVEGVIAGKVVIRAGRYRGSWVDTGSGAAKSLEAVHLVLVISTIIVVITLKEVRNAFAILAVKEVFGAVGG